MIEPLFSHPKPRPTTPRFFFDISFLADLKQKIKSNNKPWHYQLECLFILGFWHRRHCHCLKLFETLHLPENESKHEVSNKSQTNIIKGASSIDTRPSRPSRKMLTPEKWQVTYDTQYEKYESVNQWVKEKGACKTAVAKMGLLKLVVQLLWKL